MSLSRIHNIAALSAGSGVAARLLKGVSETCALVQSKSLLASSSIIAYLRLQCLSSAPGWARKGDEMVEVGGYLNKKRAALNVQGGSWLWCSVMPDVLGWTKCHCSIFQVRDVVRSAEATARIHWEKDWRDIRSTRLRVISGYGLLYGTPILSELRLR
jgi:hypothetical protein